MFGAEAENRFVRGAPPGAIRSSPLHDHFVKSDTHQTALEAAANSAISTLVYIQFSLVSFPLFFFVNGFNFSLVFDVSI